LASLARICFSTTRICESVFSMSPTCSRIAPRPNGSSAVFPTGPLGPAKPCRFSEGSAGVVPGCALWANIAVAAKTTVTLTAFRNIIFMFMPLEIDLVMNRLPQNSPAGSQTPNDAILWLAKCDHAVPGSNLFAWILTEPKLWGRANLFCLPSKSVGQRGNRSGRKKLDISRNVLRRLAISLFHYEAVRSE
jgi:hypothetical protein